MHIKIYKNYIFDINGEIYQMIISDELQDKDINSIPS